MFPPASSGGAIIKETSRKVIRFVKQGCTNRPFFHIVVMHRYDEQYDQCIEQVGSFDPIPNKNNEKLVALNYDRIQYWIKQRAGISPPVSELLGLCGFLPVHPETYMKAWRFRKSIIDEIRTFTPSGVTEPIATKSGAP